MSKGRAPIYALPVPGQTFTRWTVLHEVPLPEQWVRTYKARYHWYMCACVCGNQKLVSNNALNGGTSRSCGCLRYHRIRDGVEWRQDAHHESGGTKRNPITKEYRTWHGIKNRCLNTRDKQYPDYGGRGITICQQWIDSYETFLADVGRAPTPQHSLGRLNNDGPYTPDNVRWETKLQQNRNMRRTHWLTFNGETLSLSEWADHVGLHRKTIQQRLRYGWPIEQALTGPFRKHYRKRQ